MMNIYIETVSSSVQMRRMVVMMVVRGARGGVVPITTAGSGESDRSWRDVRHGVEGHGLVQMMMAVIVVCMVLLEVVQLGSNCGSLKVVSQRLTGDSRGRRGRRCTRRSVCIAVGGGIERRMLTVWRGRKVWRRLKLHGSSRGHHGWGRRCR